MRRALTRRCQSTSPKNMRGCHDPAGVRAVGRRETRIEVSLSERNPEPNRRNRTRALPVSRPTGTVAVRSEAWRNPADRDCVLSVRVEERAKIRASQPDEPGGDPLYMFGCSLSWRKQDNASAGWELVRCLRSSGQTARIAAALLARAKHVRLP